jgi:hypothetical protein
VEPSAVTIYPTITGRALDLTALAVGERAFLA